MANLYDVIKRPLVTEKGVTKKDDRSHAVLSGGCRCQQDPDPACGGSGFQGEGGRSPDVDDGGQAAAARASFRAIARTGKKPGLRLKAGEKMPEYAEI